MIYFTFENIIKTKLSRRLIKREGNGEKGKACSGFAKGGEVKEPSSCEIKEVVLIEWKWKGRRKIALSRENKLNDGLETRKTSHEIC